MAVKACVLLSTYNGEQYLKQQIDSIFNQNNATVSLLIRDDGSSDTTIHLIDAYIRQGCSIELIQGKNVGPGASFFELIKYAPYGYDIYLLSDQDDIWLPDKVSISHNAIFNYNVLRIPALYCSNQILYVNGNETGFRFNSEPNHCLIATLFGNHISGCTFAFNSELLNVLKSSKVSDEILKIRMHDTWIMLLANLTGKVIYDEASQILYRIHDNNTIGLSDIKLNRRLHSFIYRLFNSYYRNGRSKTAKALLNSGVLMTPEDRSLLSLIADYDKSLINKLSIIKNSTIMDNCPDNRIVLLFKLLVNWV